MKKSLKSHADLPPIRVRKEPPTIAEAVAAAQDLADDVEQQVEIAAGLMGVPADEVRPQVLAAAQQQQSRSSSRVLPERLIASAGPNRTPRTVVVERRSRPPVVVERRGGRLPIEPRR